MSVDNASVKDMDFSELIIDEPDLWMVQWQEGKGEIERQVVIDGSGDGDLNLNGLRETFIDIIPYCPLFQQFLTKMKDKALLLPQAKKVQNDLITEVFNSKRQEPYYYKVASGNYGYWDASDANLFASTVPALQNAIAKVNEIISRLNAQFPALQAIDDNLSARDNSVCAIVNANVVNPGDVLTAQVNANVVTPGEQIRAEINGNIVNYMNSNASTVSAACASSPILEDGGTSTAVAKPGLGSALLQSPGLYQFAFAAVNADFLTCSIAPLATVGWTAMSNVTQTNVSWIPIGQSTPVTVTPAESAAILNGIAARTNALQAKKATKQAQVNALTTVDAVIAYDVTTGW